MTRKLGKQAQKNLKAAQAKQERQIARITKLVGKYERQGFTVSKSLKNRLKVSGTSTNAANKKLKSLKKIREKDVKAQLKGYTGINPKTGKVSYMKGKKGVAYGMKHEAQKETQAEKTKRFSVDKVSDMMSNAADHVYYDKNGNHVGGDGVDVSRTKMSVISAWHDYTSRGYAHISQSAINKVWGLLEDLQQESQSENEYDDTAQKIISELTGAPANADSIGGDEALEMIDIS